MELTELLRHLRERRETVAPEEAVEEVDAFQPGSLLLGLAQTQAMATPPAAQERARAGQRGAAGTNAPAGDIQEMVKRMAAKKYGWKGGQWNALQELVQRESSWNPKADNPTSTAYGLFQFLDSTRKNYGIGLGAGPKGQSRGGLKYILDRYGTPKKALQHHDRMNWY